MAGGRATRIGGPLMRWLAEILSPALVRQVCDLRARAAHYAVKAADAEALAETRGRNEKRLARDINDLERRLKWQAEVITHLRKHLEIAIQPEDEKFALLRKELDAQKRVNDRLADQLLDAVGNNAAALNETARKALGLTAGGGR